MLNLEVNIVIIIFIWIIKSTIILCYSCQISISKTANEWWCTRFLAYSRGDDRRIWNIWWKNVKLRVSFTQ